MKPDDILDESNHQEEPPISKAEILWELEIAQRKIRVAKIMLIVLGSLYLAFYVISFLLQPDASYDSVFEAIAVGTFFILCGLLTKRYPAGTLSLAFLIYLGYQIVVALFYGMEGIMSGVIWKIIIFSALLVGIRGAVQYRKLKDKLEQNSNS